MIDPSMVNWMCQSLQKIANALETLAEIAKRRDQEDARAKDKPSPPPGDYGKIKDR